MYTCSTCQKTFQDEEFSLYWQHSMEGTCSESITHKIPSKTGDSEVVFKPSGSSFYPHSPIKPRERNSIASHGGFQRPFLDIPQRDSKGRNNREDFRWTPKDPGRKDQKGGSYMPSYRPPNEVKQAHDQDNTNNIQISDIRKIVRRELQDVLNTLVKDLARF